MILHLLASLSEKISFLIPEFSKPYARRPGGFSHLKFNLSAGGQKQFYEVAGNARSLSFLKGAVKEIMSEGYIEKKETP